MSSLEKIFQEAITLKPVGQTKLVDSLISALDKSNLEIDKLWAKEVESRLDAYNNGQLKSVSLDKVLSKYKCAYDKHELDLIPIEKGVIIAQCKPLILA